MPSLIIDMRERALMAELVALHIPYTTANLDIGDILIQNAEGEPILVAERKTHADFAASLMDGRYREQRTRLMATRGQGIAVLYLLEGSWSTAVDRVYPGGTSEVQLQRLTSRLVLRYGFPLIQTASVRDTAVWCSRLLDQITAEPEVFHPTKGLAAETAGAMATYSATFNTVKKSNKNVEDIATMMLSSLPGFGAKRAAVLLKTHSIADLVALSAEEIAALSVADRKLGAKLGALMHVIFNAKCK